MKSKWIVLLLALAVLMTSGVASAATTSSSQPSTSGGSTLRNGGPRGFGGPGGPGDKRGGPGGIGGPGGVIQAVEKATGLTADAIMTARKSGQSFSQILASKGQDVSAFIAAQVAARKVELDKLVASGKMTSDQETTALTNFQTQLKKMLDDATIPPAAPEGLGDRRGGPGGMGGPGGVMQAVAKSTGLTPDAIMTARKSGQSVSQILTSKGQDASAFITAQVAARKVELDKLVTAGKMTADQETTALTNFQTQLKKMLDDTTIPQAPPRKPAGAQITK